MNYVRNTPLSTTDRSSEQKINKDTVALNDTLHQMDFIDIYRAFHPKEAKHTFFSNAHGSFSKKDHKVRHKTQEKLKKIEIISNIFSDHNGLKLETNNKEKTQKHSNA